MITAYMTALAPAKGGDGEINRYREKMVLDSGWYSPLSVLIPLNLYKTSFPRDRVDPEGLNKLPALILKGPETQNGHIILQLTEDVFYSDYDSMFREIHGKRIPEADKSSFINWKGLLLNPRDLNFGKSGSQNNTSEIVFQLKRWQLGLYRIRYDEKRQWWENFSYSCLWVVRKPASR